MTIEKVLIAPSMYLFYIFKVFTDALVQSQRYLLRTFEFLAQKLICLLSSEVLLF